MGTLSRLLRGIFCSLKLKSDFGPSDFIGLRFKLLEVFRKPAESVFLGCVVLKPVRYPLPHMTELRLLAVNKQWTLVGVDHDGLRDVHQRRLVGKFVCAFGKFLEDAGKSCREFQQLVEVAVETLTQSDFYGFSSADFFRLGDDLLGAENEPLLIAHLLISFHLLM